ncbi:hypothetical protein RAMLITH_02770 [Ramlibacter sp. RBP-2]|uniref:Uncharacterized protein n=1 Tax=Ramlibacter lithotrophicus TaxID=2606681 RepID=A0A7X6I557_9BURK|nr:hypothetical protein [Ramlibacter lithotrophicus]NKE64734.1 hypothetical protein [Ramlibacter lithotrophicus]
MAAWVLVVAASGLAGAASHPSYWRRVTTFGAVVGLAAFLNGFALGPERSLRQLDEEAPFRWRNVLVAMVIVLLGRYLLRMMD